MKKRFRKPSGDLKPERLPKPDRAFIAADHKIKLHRAEPPPGGVFQRMQAHGSRYAAAGGVGRGDVAAVSDVGTAAFLVGVQEISAEDGGVFFRDKNVVLQ